MSDLLVAGLIGLAFGWALESAGLGDPPRLAGLFYLRDFTVVKVMVSALVTAMLGLFWLGRLGLVEIGSLYLPGTWWLPQLVGGLVFGLGFLLAGLCPGTSCVALAGGRIEGAATMIGLVLGALLTGLAFAWIEPFYDSTARGALTLPDLLGLPDAWLVAAITLAGVGTLAAIARHEARR